MNLKLIIYASIIILILSSLLIFGYISYTAYSDDQNNADAFFASKNWLFYTKIGIEAAILVMVGLLFIKR